MRARPHKCIRVFPRRTKATPIDDYAFVGDPPLFRPEADTVLVSCAFTWDKPEAERLHGEWRMHYDDVRLGGPAYDDRADWFIPGLFLRPGYTITSRGCNRRCGFCYVPRREGRIRELPIASGVDVADNNLLACSDEHVENVFAMLRTQRKRVRFSGGLEARRVDDRAVTMLQSLRLLHAQPGLFVAYDSPADDVHAHNAITLLRRRGLSRRTVGCYVLIGYGDDTLDAAESRLREVWAWGALPFAMLYRGDDGKTTREWRAFQRSWCRPAAIIATMGASDA